MGGFYGSQCVIFDIGLGLNQKRLLGLEVCVILSAILVVVVTVSPTENTKNEMVINDNM